MRRVLLPIVLLFFATACGVDDEPEVFTASGTVSIIGVNKVQVLAADGAGDGDPCQGAGPLGEFDEEAETVVLDAEGTKIAVGELGPGAMPVGKAESLAQLGLAQCEFEFSVSEIPVGNDLYTLQIGETDTTFKQGDQAIEVTVAGDEYP